eukprot:EG_transcript_10424
MVQGPRPAPPATQPPPQPQAVAEAVAVAGALEGKVLLLVRTSGNSRLAAYRRLQALGLRLVFVHPARNFAEPVAWRWILTDTNDAAAMVRTVVAQLREMDLAVDGVTSFDEYGVYPAARLAEFLGLRPCPAPSDVVRETNIKSLFRKHCQLHGIGSPRCLSLHSLQDTDHVAAAGLVYPLVVKPSSGAGSGLVRLVRDEAELAECVAASLAALATGRDYRHWANTGTPPHLLVEEFVAGDEVDIDCVVQDGRLMYAAVSDNFPTEAPYFCETGGLAPSRLPTAQQAALLAQLQRFVASHGTALHGVMHFEAKYDPQRGAAYVIEVNLRMGGAETHCLNLHAWGHDLAESCARLACGLPVPSAPGTPLRAVASCNFRPPTAGTLRRQTLPEKVVADAHFCGALLYYDPGTRVDLPPASFAALGWLCASGAGAEEALEHLRRLAAQVQFDIQ